MTETGHIFISYARRDGSNYAHDLDISLTQHGFNTWRDTRGIDPAQDFTAEIERAIKASSHIVTCITPDTSRDDSFVRREIQYALVIGKRVIVARFDENTPPPIHIINHTWIDFHNNWDTAFEQLVNVLEKSPDDFQKSHLSSKVDDPFRPYLERLYERVVAFLSQSVISFIKLDVETTLETVSNEYHRPDMLDQFFLGQGINDTVDDIDTFKHFDDAFKKYNGRVLLLGDPGAGKTITLMAQTRDAVAARLSDSQKPLPLLGLISTWDAEKTEPLVDWLTKGYHELPVKNLQNIISEGNTLLLLDGLDELGGERIRERKIEKEIITENYDPRIHFMEQIPENNGVIVTCRVKDYAEIGRKINLNGAITLKPLGDAQLDDYLSQQLDLLTAVTLDTDLRTMLRTPLILSIFAFAFRDKGETAKKLQDFQNSPEELRDEIFRTYIGKRYEWETRKHEIPFTLTMIYQILGQLALVDAAKQHQNKIGIEDIKQILDDDGISFSEVACKLHILNQRSKDEFGFLHLLLRNHFAWDQLLPVLQNTDSKEDQIADAARAIKSLADNRAFNPLIEILDSRGKDYTSDTLVAIIAAFEQLENSRASKSIITFLDHDDKVVRRVVSRTLRRLGNIPSVDPLLGVLNDSDYFVKQFCIEVLGKISDTRVVQPLIDKLSDTQKPPRNPLDILEDILDLAEAQKREDELKRSGSHTNNMKVGDTDKGQETKRQISPSRPKEKRIYDYAIQALVDIGLPAVPLLEDSLESSTEIVRINTVEAIQQISGVPGLLSALRNPDGRAYWEITRKLIKIAQNNMDMLVDALLDEFYRVRGFVAYAFGELGESEYGQYLVPLLDDEKHLVRYMAAEALGKLKYELAVEPLTQQLSNTNTVFNDGDSRVCDAVTVALNKLGDVMSVLVAGLESDDANVRQGVAYGIGRVMGTSELLNFLHNPDSHASWEITKSLSRNAKNDADMLMLVEALSDEYYRVRGFVAHVLGELGKNEVGQHLVPLLEDNVHFVRYMAAEALGKLKYEPAIEPLIQQLSNTNTVFSNGGKRICDIATEALENINNERALEAVENWRQSESIIVEGEDYYNKGQYEQAIKCYEQGISLRKILHGAINQHLLLRLGRCYEYINEYKEAIKVYEEAVDLYGNTYHLSIARIYRFIGETEKATFHLKQAREALPDDSYYDLACLESIEENIEGALQYLAKAVSQNPHLIDWAQKDFDLRNLQEHPDFLTILGIEK